MTDKERKVLIITLSISIFLILIIAFLAISHRKEKETFNQEEYERYLRDQEEKRQDEEMQKEKEMEEQRQIEEEKNRIYNEKINYREEMDHLKEKREENYKNAIANLEKNLLELKYAKNSNCYNKIYDEDICFSDNNIEVVYSKKINRLEISKEINYSDLKNYDSKNDLELIGKLLNNEKIKDNSNEINNLLKKISEGYFDSFTVDIDGLYINISNYYSDLSYTISPSIFFDYDVLKLSYIGSIIRNKDKPNSYIEKKVLYDFAMSFNKNNYKYYDYATHLFDSNSNNICNINYSQNDGFLMESDYCHGGTSNTSFSFNYQKYNDIDYNTITISIKGDYFKKEYLDIINKDLKYFSNKLNSKLELTANNKKELSEFVNKDSLDLSLEVNNKFEIKITYKPSSYYKSYDIEYIIK